METLRHADNKEFLNHGIRDTNAVVKILYDVDGRCPRDLFSRLNSLIQGISVWLS